MRTPAPIRAPLNLLSPETIVNNPAWIEWFQRISDYYETIARWIDIGRLDAGTVEPYTPQEGMLAYANGSDWNPGSGEGYYVRRASVWDYVGTDAPAPGSVVAETTFGLSPSVGVSVNYAKADHTHGTPVDPVIAHEAAPDPHPQYITTAFAAIWPRFLLMGA